jgi:hypothetical protein
MPPKPISIEEQFPRLSKPTRRRLLREAGKSRKSRRKAARAPVREPTLSGEATGGTKAKYPPTRPELSQRSMRERALSRRSKGRGSTKTPRPLIKQATAERKIRGGSGSSIGRIGKVLGRGGGAFSLINMPAAARGALQEGRAAYYKARYGETKERTRKRRLHFSGGA